MKIALFGGTFDPVHSGHLNAAKEVLRQGLVDQVWFIPVKSHAFKQNSGITGFQHRKKMVELAIEGIAGLKTTDLKENPVYTIDTIKKAEKLFPKNSYFWLMGTTLVQEFSSWKQPKEILEHAKLILYPVPGSEEESSTLIEESNPIKVKGKAIDLSSTAVREKLQSNEKVQDLLPKNVLAYIKENSLYKRKG